MKFFIDTDEIIEIYENYIFDTEVNKFLNNEALAKVLKKAFLSW